MPAPLLVVSCRLLLLLAVAAGVSPAPPCSSAAAGARPQRSSRAALYKARRARSAHTGRRKLLCVAALVSRTTDGSRSHGKRKVVNALLTFSAERPRTQRAFRDMCDPVRSCCAGLGFFGPGCVGQCTCDAAPQGWKQVAIDVRLELHRTVAVTASLASVQAERTVGRKPHYHVRQ